MFFSLKEVSIWTGLSPFELLWQVIAFTCFSVVAVLKVEQVEGYYQISWLKIFIPLFAVNCFNAYFSVIVLVRSVLNGEVKKAIQRTGWTLIQLLLWTVYYVLVVQKLESDLIPAASQYSHPETMAPLFIILVLNVFRSR
ncbi:hypothetical protein RvY_08081-1 [Ramazzottius varieornatus]|uniref:Intimal thickness related receptor IRP domain-containing protein n=1 Tax=Ramazzottius varieornatus TaxID=947166 RepID=A0A1D1V4I0_RAMVA|nr:hypothetical protein RvY_08081-1 [Ramazzottius varieornatus]